MFDATSILAGLFVSSIGFVLFSYGRKMSRPPQMVAGVVLLVFPYFVPGVGWMLGAAGAVLGLTWLAVQQGY
jgi:hypothetical protein